MRLLEDETDPQKCQELIDQYYTKHKKLPSIEELGPIQIYKFYKTLLRSDKNYIIKYIDEIRALEKNKIFASSYLAKLEDRLRYLDNKPSLYGTIQIEEGQEPYPIEDEQNLNNRRIEMGLPYLGSNQTYFMDLIAHYKIK